MSDPLPQIVEGDAAADALDPGRPRPAGLRPQPDQLRPVPVDATLLGDEGAARSPSHPLPGRELRRPRPTARSSSMKLTGGLKRRGHPAIHAVLTAQPGEANTPHGLGDPAEGRASRQRPHRNGLHAARSSRPTPARPARRSATPRLRRPLLDQPLSGVVYLRSSNHGCPTSRSICKGQVDIELVGQDRQRQRQRLRTTFETVPDVPVSQVRPRPGGR